MSKANKSRKTFEYKLDLIKSGLDVIAQCLSDFYERVQQYRDQPYFAELLEEANHATKLLNDCRMLIGSSVLMLQYDSTDIPTTLSKVSEDLTVIVSRITTKVDTVNADDEQRLIKELREAKDNIQAGSVSNIAAADTEETRPPTHKDV